MFLVLVINEEYKSRQRVPLFDFEALHNAFAAIQKIQSNIERCYYVLYFNEKYMCCNYKLLLIPSRDVPEMIEPVVQCC